MVKTKRGFIFASFIFSCAATVLAIVAIATENWISASIKPNGNIITDISYVTYGLFSGVFVKNLLGTNKAPITVECIFSENICGYSSKTTQEEREQDLQGILSGSSCLKTGGYISSELNLFDEVRDVSVEIFDENSVMYKRKASEKLQILRVQRNVGSFGDNNTNTNNKCDPTFLNAGLWVTTLIFLSFAIVIGAFTGIVSVMNAAGNPISPWLNIWGLYIWNGVAACLHVFSLILWGIQYNLFIIKNVAIIDTLQGIYNNETAHLGYSFWILLAPLVLHVSNCGLFYLRQYLIDKEPEIPEEKIDVNTNGMIFVY